MPANNGFWPNAELQTFLTIIGDSNIQAELDGMIRNEKVFKEVSQHMAAEGFQRTSEQCRAKLKKIKAHYRKVKDSNDRSGNGRSTWKWYDVVDAIYGCRPSNLGSEAGLDSATSILESLVNPVDTSEAENTPSSEEPSTSSSSTPGHSVPPSPLSTTIREEHLPCRRRTGDRRRRLEARTQMIFDELQIADGRQMDRMEGISREQVNWMQQDTAAARQHELQIAEQYFEHLGALNAVLGLVAQIMGSSSDFLPPPRQ
ncbi:zinc finger and SCAN domain-containing protein 29-like [Nothobranchius furzeri]|uniref:Zinc finger and SCAN domain-containing protein 29-like n=1 Tax=Nothobranchius furzeri TaxID=105023 RepID=A0A9D2XCZ8_NOTFU|nr:zinc finger and SCAN domain-containing protein 29-like [Nothobranchius furzeri]